jgi:hypothetical protein
MLSYVKEGLGISPVLVLLLVGIVGVFEQMPTWTWALGKVFAQYAYCFCSPVCILRIAI